MLNQLSIRELLLIVSNLRCLITLLDSNVGPSERYFEENTERGIEKLEAAVQNDPKNAQLWLKLTDKKLKVKDSNRLDIIYTSPFCIISLKRSHPCAI